MRRTLILVLLGLLLAACASTSVTENGPVTPDAGGASIPTLVRGVTAAAETQSADGNPFSNGLINLPEPSCAGSFTPEQTEGPYYKAGSSERNTLLEPGMTGTRLVLVGYVLDADCKPIPGAWLGFWQADASGRYDNQGYTLRGHQVTDSLGRYYLETVVPGEYPGRTEHIHVKVQPPGGKVLTSQLYFPGVSENNADQIFTPATLIRIEDKGDYQLGFYNFVLETR